MAKQDVIMPQMGESIAEGTLTKWLKQKGDMVERDEDLFEISTDKVDADIPSPVAGKLVEILVEEGSTVEVNTVVARIETDAEAGEEEAGAEEAGGEAKDEAAAGEEPAKREAGKAGEAEEADEEPEEEEEKERRPAAEREGGARVDIGEDEGPQSREERIRTRSTPVVRKIAAEHGVDISEVEGSGISGRVTRDDIEAYIESGAAEKAKEKEAAVEKEKEPAAAKAAPGQPARKPAEQAAAPGTMRVPIHGASLDIKIPSVPVREGDRVE
ncbi:MAG TPA: hypothetical protein ENO23_06965, partial [Alphaproteobacteria bacterium]|nr:hypothetical protein [Alphaproteobacteria bacterium]